MTLPPPRDYPWPEPERSGLLTRPGFLEGVPAGLDGRTPVAAVGSNASPTILRHKLGPLLDTGLPIDLAEIDGLSVGHSAHVSARGYVAAAPICTSAHADGSEPRAVTLAWFDPDQLAALDATEPNYRRVPLPGRMPCRRGGVILTGVEVYASVHGVLGEAGAALAFLDQRGVLAWLADRLPGHLADGLDHEALTSADRREQVRAALIAADLVVPSGF